MKLQKALRTSKGYLGAFLFLIIFWHLAAIFINLPILPTPGKALAASWRLLQGELTGHLLISSYRVLVSLLISFLLGVPLGLWMGYSSRADRLLAPIVYLTYPIPKIVFLPLILLFLGLGDVSKIFLLTLIVFYQILVTTRDAVRKISVETIDSLRSLGGTKTQIYKYVLWPASLPDVLTALRISTGTAIAVLFFAESFATTKGLGYFIMDAWARSAPDEMFAGILIMGVLGVVLFLAVDVLEYVFCRWQKLKKQ
ncbi:MAG: ABC transporter permease [Peptococcaceae bacterium]|jgi:ABC-type nitrate/sulfonate/bicarbonate transport system permease component|nr:ABC transporter permease [Peptococcaceae bacterium]